MALNVPNDGDVDFNIYWGGEHATVDVIAGNSYTFSTCGGGAWDTQITLFEEGSATFIGFNDDSACGLQSEITWTATFTGTVRVVVNEWDCITNSEDMVLTVTNNGPGAGAPANDGCATATNLPVNAGCVMQNFTTDGATLSLDAPACSGGDPNDDVWFTFTATTADANVNVQGSAEFDAVLQVFSGSCGGFTEISCADVSFDGGAEAAVLTGLTVGQVYYVRVYHWYTAAPTTATFDICVRSVGVAGTPPNDNCATAVGLTPSAACVPTAGTVEGATASAPVIVCEGTGDADVWYSFVANDVTATVTLSPNGTMDAVVQVLSGACATPTELDCVDLTVDAEDEVVNLVGLVPGETYYVRVYDFYGAATPPADATFDICVTSGAAGTPANDDCDMFTVLTQQANGSCVTTAGTVIGATESTPAGCTGTADDDVWYRFVATDTVAEVRVAGAGGDFDPVIEFIAEDCATSLLCVDNAVDGNETVSLTGLVVGQVYRFRVYHWYAATPTDGAFTVCVTTPGPPAAPTTFCNNMTPICTDLGAAYQAQSGGTIEPGYASDCAQPVVPGNDYGCLCSQPDPTWFYLEIDNPGDIIFTVSAIDDIDFALWGPFANLAAAQGACGSLGVPMDCSFDPTEVETVTLTGGVTGQVYILLVTNYANIVQDVTATQTGGTGSTNCAIVVPCAADAGGW